MKLKLFPKLDPEFATRYQINIGNHFQTWTQNLERGAK